MKKGLFFSILAITAIGWSIAGTAHAQTTPDSMATSTVINTATSTTVILNLPANYQGSVVTNYDGTKFVSYATTSPLTSQDIETIDNNLAAEETAFNNFFAQQEQMFNQFWSNLAW
jgi:hypothetical protein